MPNRFICAALLLLLITLYIMSINDHWRSFEFHIHDRRCAPGNVSGGTYIGSGTRDKLQEILRWRFGICRRLVLFGCNFHKDGISGICVSIAKRECQSLIQVVVVE